LRRNESEPAADCGCSGLPRKWIHPIEFVTAPATFIPRLEETGLIVEVGTWVLRQANLDYRNWQVLAIPATKNCRTSST
jgi:EAL domain-containing protein (putative c-di-GMP-specific phosphodiesterase class I)